MRSTSWVGAGVLALAAGCGSTAGGGGRALLTIAPTTASLAPRQTQQFHAGGGTAPYVFSAGAGSIDASGLYTAPATGSADTVTVTDAAHAHANATVTLSAALTISPAMVSLSPHQTQLFRGNGGLPPYTFSSGVAGAVDSAGGLYTAPASGTGDTVTVTDSLGAKATAAITLVPLPAIASFTAAEPLVTSGLSAKLSAVFSGGTGSIDHDVGTVQSGVTVNATVTGNTTFTLTVTSALGVQTTGQVTVQTVAAPAIQSFTASAPSTISTVTPQTVDLSATFSGGTGVIAPGSASITSGTHVTVAPLDTTVYTLSVSNGASTPATVTAAVSVLVARRIGVARGDGQTATVATALPNPLVALVTDATDAGVPGVPVHWNYPSYPYGALYQWPDAGTSLDGVTITDSQGEAQVAAQLGTYAAPSAYNFYASVDNLQDGTTASFPESATPGAVTNLAAQGATTQISSANAVASSTPAVQAQDQYGNGVPGVDVQFAVLDGGGYLLDAGTQLAAEIQTTGATGVATSSAWTMGSAVGNLNDEVEATLAASSASPVDFVASAEIIPSNGFDCSSCSTARALGRLLVFEGSYTNSSDGANTIDQGVAPGPGGVGGSPFAGLAARAAFDYPTSPGTFDPTEQKSELVTYTFTSANGATPPSTFSSTVTITVLDSEWPQWLMPGSATANCIKPSDDSSVVCSDPSAAGEDGALHENPPAYSSSGSGLATDSVSGLTWSAACESGSMGWSAAVSACRSKTGGPWRLPTAEELFSLLDYGKTPPTPGAPFTFPTVNGAFWTSSIDAYNVYNNSLRAWTVNFYTGEVLQSGQTETHYVRCVQ